MLHVEVSNLFLLTCKNCYNIFTWFFLAGLPDVLCRPHLNLYIMIKLLAQEWKVWTMQFYDHRELLCNVALEMLNLAISKFAMCFTYIFPFVHIKKKSPHIDILICYKNGRHSYRGAIDMVADSQQNVLTHFCPPLRFRNQFLPTVPTFAVWETDVSRHNGGTSGAPLKPLRVDSFLRALSSLRGLRGAPAVPPSCQETQSLGQQMLERIFIWYAWLRNWNNWARVPNGFYQIEMIAMSELVY